MEFCVNGEKELKSGVMARLTPKLILLKYLVWKLGATPNRCTYL
jgi:hypothetical protein